MYFFFIYNVGQWGPPAVIVYSSLVRDDSQSSLKNREGVSLPDINI